MKIQFLGTGAADWNWKVPLTSDVRGSTSTLLDGKILIDAGETGWQNITRFQADPAEITDLLITHSHSDHFNAEQIRQIATAPGRKETLTVYTSPEAVQRLDAAVMNTVAMKFGDKFVIQGLEFEVLSANHVLSNDMEAAYHFVIVTPEKKRLFYALDSGWMTSYTRTKLGRTHLDMIIWDATTGTTRNDWRFADHNDLWMIQSMRESMEKLEIINEKTVHIFDHIARTLWPVCPDERKKTAESFQGILAEDGLIIKL